MNLSPSFQIISGLFYHLRPYVKDRLVRHLEQFKSIKTWSISDPVNKGFIGNLVQRWRCNPTDAWRAFHTCVQEKLDEFQTGHQIQDEVLQQRLEHKFKNNVKACINCQKGDFSNRMWLSVNATDEAFVKGLVMELVQFDIQPPLHPDKKDSVRKRQ